jgi:hypothetical protein
MRLLLASSLLFAAPSWAQQFSEIEPNDTPAQAQAVPLGQQCNSSLVLGETDWYSFTTPGGYHGLTTSGGGTAVTDVRMVIYESTGTTAIAYCDDSQSTLASIWMNLSAGTYLVRIDGGVATAAGDYSLDISNPMSKPLNGFESEPNDTIATANPVADGAQIGASLTPPVSGVLLDTVAAPPIVASNTVTTSTTTSITTSGLVAGTYNGTGYFVQMTSGPNAGSSRRITANTATSITTEAWPIAQGPGDTFDITGYSLIVTSDTVISATTSVITQTTPVVASIFTPSGSHAVRMTSGPNAGLSRNITSNTATTITTSAFPTANTAGNTFDIVVGGGTSSIVVTTPLVASQFNDQRSWLRCTSGVNVGQSRCILRNTASYLLTVVAFASTPAPGDTFEVDQYDSDTYRVDVTSPVAEVVFSITDGDDNWVSTWSYEVLDGLGVRIPASLGTGLADSSAFNPRVSSFRVWTAGTYYVRVFQRRTAVVSTAALVPYGNYRFELKHKDMSTGSSTEIEAVGGPNANNTIFTSELLVPGQAHIGNITDSAGADPTDLWGPIVVTNQTLFTFQVTTGSAPGMSDSTVNLRQVVDPVLGTLATTAVLIGNILEPANLNPRGSFNLLLPGTTYYLEVMSPGTGAGQSGNYSLEVSGLDSPTYVAGNFVTVAANASGCGTAGVPTINRVQGSVAGAAYGELPVVGQSFVTRTTNLNGVGNLGLLVIGTTGASGPVYNPVAVDLTPIGAPGCTLNADPLIIEVLIGDPSGTADYVLPTPGNLSLAGATLFLQPCKWDFATPINTLGIQPGNWMRVIFGARNF